MDKYSASEFMNTRWKSSLKSHRDSFSDTKSEFCYDNSSSALNRSVLNLQTSSRRESMQIYENSYKQITSETTQIPFSKVPLLSFQSQIFKDTKMDDSSTPLTFSGSKRPKVKEQDTLRYLAKIYCNLAFTTPTKKSMNPLSDYKEHNKVNPREKRVKIMSKQTLMNSSVTSVLSPENVKSI